MLPVIDTHQHLWDPARQAPPWLQPGDPLYARFGPAEYADATRGLNIVKAIYMEVAMDPPQLRAEADYVIGLCESAQTVTCAAVISGRPEADDFSSYIRPYKNHKYVKGIRRLLRASDTPPGFCLNPQFVKGIQLLGELGLSFDLCARPTDLPDLAQLVDQCPGTRFILDHCGDPNVRFTPAQWDQWRQDMTNLARRPNVIAKVSGVVVNGTERGKWTADDLAPAVNGTIESFGWDRVVFGGDWPVCTRVGSYQDWFMALKQILSNQSEENQRKLFHDNAAKFYGV
jgi:predicted TIM-barrel fold metal-dependent hydrolase